MNPNSAVVPAMNRNSKGGESQTHHWRLSGQTTTLHLITPVSMQNANRKYQIYDTKRWQSITKSVALTLFFFWTNWFHKSRWEERAHVFSDDWCLRSAV